MKKVFILIITILFSVQYIAGAAVPMLIENAPAIPRDIFIPESYGVIEKSSFDKYMSGKFIILLKDAHCNYDAQHNIAKILEVLIKEYKIDLIAMEGAVGDLDYSRFDKMDNETAREKMADSFVKKGVLTGPEYLKISKDGKLSFNVYGIENEKLYVENFIAFREAINHQGETLLFINELSRIAKNLKSRIYQKELFEFDTKSMQYYENAISLTDWIKELNTEAGKLGIVLNDCPNIMLTLDSIALEDKIDFKKVEIERAEAIGDIEKTLPKEGLKEMVEKSLRFRLGRISSCDYYGYLEKLLESLSGVDPASKFSNLTKYIQLVKLQTWISNDALFNEIAKLEDTIKEAMFQNNIQRQLDDISKKARILNGLFNLTLNRDDFLYYRNHRLEFMPDSMISFINIQAPLHNVPASILLSNREFLDKVSSVITDGEKFYDIAVQRDVSLVENTLQVMEERKKQSAVMVLGGFHTEGVLNLFEAKGVGYAVITPKIVTAEKEGLYISLMMDKRIHPVHEESSLSFPHPFASGAENERLLIRLGAGGLRIELLGAAEQLYNKYLGKLLEKKGAEVPAMPFNIVVSGNEVRVSINSEFTSEIPRMLIEWYRMGLEEVLRSDLNLARFIAEPGNLEKYLNKTAVLEYEHSVGHTRQEGILRRATLGFVSFYLGVCREYESGGLLNLSPDIRREFLPEGIKKIEKGEGYKWPDIRDKLVPEMQRRGLDETTAQTVVNYLFTMPAYGIDEKGEFYQTLFFNSYLTLIKDVLNVKKDDELDRLLDGVKIYRYVQTYAAKILGVNPEPILETDNVKSLVRGKTGKAVEILARHIASNGEELKDYSEDIGKVIKRKRELSGWKSNDWLAEANVVSVRNENIVSDPIKRNVYAAVLTRIGLADVLTASDRYNKNKGKFEEGLAKADAVAAQFRNRTFVRDISMYIGDVKEVEAGKYEYSDLGTVDIESVRAVQLSRQNNQYFLYKEDRQKEAMKAYLAKYGITVSDGQFVKPNEYKDIPREGRVIVTMLSDGMKQEIAGISRDRVLYGNPDGSDLMLMSRLALVVAGPEDIEKESGRIRDEVRDLFRRYYMGTIDESEIEKLLGNISITEGILRIILPPITPFVREYYDTLMKSREVISKAA